MTLTIEQSLLQRMEDELGDCVWCYKRHFFSRLFILGGIPLEQVKELAEKQRLWLEQVFNAESYWGISGTCDDILTVWKICEEAEMARAHCDIEHQVLCYSTEMADRGRVYFPESARERIISGVRSGNYPTVRDTLDIIFDENRDNRSVTRASLLTLNQKYTDLITELHRPEGEVPPEIDELNRIASHLDSFSGEYYQAVQDAFLTLYGAYNREKNSQKIQLVEDIKQFIMQNWQNADLGLPMISKKFQLSEGYVSTLFKEQAGVNFVSFVEDIRLEHACQMLQTSDMSMDEIAAAVGYNSVQSFRRAFKRVYNESPNSYRKSRK